jgi:hypothetical protein
MAIAVEARHAPQRPQSARAGRQWPHPGSLIADGRLLTIDDGHLFRVTSAGKSMIAEFLI